MKISLSDIYTQKHNVVLQAIGLYDTNSMNQQINHKHFKAAYFDHLPMLKRKYVYRKLVDIIRTFTIAEYYK